MNVRPRGLLRILLLEAPRHPGVARNSCKGVDANHGPVTKAMPDKILDEVQGDGFKDSNV